MESIFNSTLEIVSDMDLNISSSITSDALTITTNAKCDANGRIFIDEGVLNSRGNPIEIWGGDVELQGEASIFAENSTIYFYENCDSEESINLGEVFGGNFFIISVFFPPNSWDFAILQNKINCLSLFVWIRDI